MVNSNFEVIFVFQRNVNQNTDMSLCKLETRQLSVAGCILVEVHIQVHTGVRGYVLLYNCTLLI